MAMSPMDVLNKIKNKAKLEEVDYGNVVAVKLNKPGKIKMNLVAMDEENLFKTRTQHFIQTLPDNDNPDEKVMVVDCQGEGCPVCKAAGQFKQAGVTEDMLNAAYKPKYPYRNVRSFLTMPEHFIVCAQVTQDGADDGSYLPKDAELGSTQFIQLPKSALNSLMEAYEDFLEDNEDNDLETLPPLFGIFGKGVEKAKCLTVTCRVQTQPYSYNFTFGKAAEIESTTVDMEKLGKLAEGPLVPTQDYLDKALNRIKDLQNYFVAPPVKNTIADKAAADIASRIDDIVDDDDLDLDAL